MRRGAGRGSDPVIARSLKMSNATFMMVGSITTLTAADAMVTSQALNALGQATVLALTFAFVIVIASAMVADMLLRSSQTISTLRSLGATKAAVVKSVFMSLFTFGSVGTALGVAIGAGLCAGLSLYGVHGTGGLVSLLTNGVVVLVMSLTALCSGVYVGVVRSWRS